MSAAAMQLAAGHSPAVFGIWLGLRMLADMLVVMHRSRERLEAIEETLGGRPALRRLRPCSRLMAPPPRAGDDGPAYPAED